jgi:branched-chain amino acid transport system permease protein
MVNVKHTPISHAAQKLIQASRWTWHEYAFWILSFALYFIFPSRLALLTEIITLGLLAMSIDLVLGFAGIVTLGQGAFFGLGAYVAGLAAKAGMGQFPLSDPIIGLVIAAAVTGLLGFITSFLVLRGSDLTRLMVTLGVGLILAEMINQMRWLTGGADGLQGVMSSPVLGMFDFDLYNRTAFIYSLSVLCLLFILARRIMHSPFGLSLRAIKGNSLRARAIGVPVNPRLIATYTLAAAYAGIAGALLAQTSQSASPDMVAFHRSADALLILVFGGAGNLYGGIVGAVAFRLLQDLFSSGAPDVWMAAVLAVLPSFLNVAFITAPIKLIFGLMGPKYWSLWLGLVLVLLVLFVRGGILGLLSSLRDRLTMRNQRGEL